MHDTEHSVTLLFMSAKLTRHSHKYADGALEYVVSILGENPYYISERFLPKEAFMNYDCNYNGIKTKEKRSFAQNDVSSQESSGVNSIHQVFEAIDGTWNVNLPLPRRRLSEAELAQWNALYCEQGGISELELEILRLTNRERAAHGLNPLVIDYALSRAARFKSQELVDLQYTTHASPVYGDFTQIPLLFIDSFTGIAENLAFTWNFDFPSITAAHFVQGWMDSPGHRANILNPNMTSLGVGVAMLPPRGVNFMNSAATQLFGRGIVSSIDYSCSSVSAPPVPPMPPTPPMPPMPPTPMPPIPGPSVPTPPIPGPPVPRPPVPRPPVSKPPMPKPPTCKPKPPVIEQHRPNNIC